MKISAQHATGHPATAALNGVADAIQAADVGLSAKVFPSNQLGDYTLVYEDIIRGNIDIAHLSIPSQLDPNLEANFFPFQVSDYDEMRRIYSPGSCFYNAYSDMQAELGVRLMGIVPEGFIGVALTKPAEHLFEAGVDKGVLIRVPPIAIQPTNNPVGRDAWTTRNVILFCPQPSYVLTCQVFDSIKFPFFVYQALWVELE